MRTTNSARDTVEIFQSRQAASHGLGLRRGCIHSCMCIVIIVFFFSVEIAPAIAINAATKTSKLACRMIPPYYLGQVIAPEGSRYTLPVLSSSAAINTTRHAPVQQIDEGKPRRHARKLCIHKSKYL